MSNISNTTKAVTPGLESLRGLKGAEYRRAWNKLHRDRCRRAQQEFKARNPERWKELQTKHSKKSHTEHVQKYGVSKTTYLSRLSEEKAISAYKRWEPSEDVMLLTWEHKAKELATKLGRSIRAVQRRRHRLTYGG
jgi:hypothetical protein